MFVSILAFVLNSTVCHATRAADSRIPHRGPCHAVKTLNAREYVEMLVPPDRRSVPEHYRSEHDTEIPLPVYFP